MADVDVALNDEGQQYGNLDEVSAIARIPRKGIVIWCGDHKQTLGGLRKSEEARVFRRKLMRRSIALRGDTTFLPPHMLGAIVHPYVKDVPGPQMAGVNRLLQESTKQPLGLSTASVALFQELCKETIGSCWEAGITPCCCAAIAVLWPALAPERFPLQVDTFSCAAGTAGKQKWALVLCCVSKDAYLENMQENTFLLTPRRIPAERKASTAKREVDQDMIAREKSVSEVGSDAESGWSRVSDNSSTDSKCTDMEASSIASDQDRFDTAYEAFQDLANDLHYIDLKRYSRGITSEDAAGVLLLMDMRNYKSWCICPEPGR